MVHKRDGQDSLRHRIFQQKKRIVPLFFVQYDQIEVGLISVIIREGTSSRTLEQSCKPQVDRITVFKQGG